MVSLTVIKEARRIEIYRYDDHTLAPPIHIGRAQTEGRLLMSTIIQQLRTEHSNFAKVLSILERQVEIFGRNEQPDYDLIEKFIDYFSVYPDAAHHPTEDLVYQKLVERDPGAATLLGDLEVEHAHLRDLLCLVYAIIADVLREGEVPRDKVRNTVQSFIEFFRSHLLMEEVRFFPAALRALSEDDWRELESKVATPVDPLFNAETVEQYRQLKDLILEVEREAA